MEIPFHVFAVFASVFQGPVPGSPFVSLYNFSLKETTILPLLSPTMSLPYELFTGTTITSTQFPCLSQELCHLLSSKINTEGSSLPLPPPLSSLFNQTPSLSTCPAKPSYSTLVSIATPVK